MKKPVRFGGQKTSSGFRFELSGGHPALDFANTLDERLGDPPRELLRGYRDLAAWGRQSGLLDSASAADSAAAARVFARAIELRERIFRLFHRYSTKGVIDGDALRAIEKAANSACSHRRLVRTRGGVAWRWDDDDPAAILWRIADAAASLAASEHLARVRTCEGPDCLWLFLDTTRQGNRRWCDMTVCGNRAKARRHYARQRSPGVRASLFTFSTPGGESEK